MNSQTLIDFINGRCDHYEALAVKAAAYDVRIAHLGRVDALYEVLRFIGADGEETQAPHNLPYSVGEEDGA